jgi:superfamily II DNA helicase RecQ
MYRHLGKALDRQFIRGLVDFNDDENDEDLNDMDRVHDLMAAHSARIGNNKYGRDGNMLHGLSAHSIKVFRPISEKWHVWLRLVSKLPRKTQVAVVPKYVSYVTVSQEILVKLHGANARYLSKEQELCIHTIIIGTSPIIAILPTAGGKTSIIMVPALVDRSKVTVVVVPLVAVAKDLVRTMRKHNISCDEWVHGNTRRSTVMVVAAETATKGDFGNFMAELYISGHFARIYFDEAHVLVTAISYRPQLEELKRLGISVQIIFLTATLPPTMAPQFEEQLLLPSPKYIRARTDRLNIRYTIHRHHGPDLNRTIAAKVNDTLKSLLGESKILVFCTSHKRCKDLAELLECGTYVSGQEDKEVKFEEWKQLKPRVLVATGALGAGVNVSGVEHVVHVDTPWGMIDFAQESGRGGRYGEEVMSTVMLEEYRYQQLVTTDPETFTADKRALREFLITDGCRRPPIGKYLDGEGKDCSQLGGVLCDHCEDLNDAARKRRQFQSGRAAFEVQRQKMYEQRTDLVRQNVRDEAVRAQTLERVLERLRGKCATCWATHGWRDCNHEFSSCKRLDQMLGSRYRDLRISLRFAPGSCCFRCVLPLDDCESFREGKGCRLEDMITPAVVAAWLDGEQEEIEELAGVKFDGMQTFLKWMTGKTNVLGKHCTNGFKVFEMLVGAS